MPRFDLDATQACLFSQPPPTPPPTSTYHYHLVRQRMRVPVYNKVIGTFFKEIVSEYKVVFKDISGGI